ncbi:unnamed protein product [Pleuronectes platessa]|uniref:Uncharacterized protein n=1 Tax=Pleuronectes platessa TaxID=8262 RepID=A0A9N7UVC2_PLEPL|nr:unnamed protein product [Pleuronectes platessa]
MAPSRLHVHEAPLGESAAERESRHCSPARGSRRAPSPWWHQGGWQHHVKHSDVSSLHPFWLCTLQNGLKRSQAEGSREDLQHGGERHCNTAVCTTVPTSSPTPGAPVLPAAERRVVTCDGGESLWTDRSTAQSAGVTGRK